MFYPNSMAPKLVSANTNPCMQNHAKMLHFPDPGDCYGMQIIIIKLLYNNDRYYVFHKLNITRSFPVWHLYGHTDIYPHSNNIRCIYI